MPQRVFVTVVTQGAKVYCRTLHAFPSYAIYGSRLAAVTGVGFMMDPWGRAEKFMIHVHVHVQCIMCRRMYLKLDYCIEDWLNAINNNIK